MSSISLMQALKERYEQGKAIHPEWPALFGMQQPEGTAKASFPEAVLKHLRDIPTYAADGAGRLVIVYQTGRARLSVYASQGEEAEDLMEAMMTFIESDPITVRNDPNCQLERESYQIMEVPAGKRGVEGQYVYLAVVTWKAMFSPP